MAPTCNTAHTASPGSAYQVHVLLL